MKFTIFISLLILLAGVGISSIISYIWRKYWQLRDLYRELKLFLESRKAEMPKPTRVKVSPIKTTPPQEEENLFMPIDYESEEFSAAEEISAAEISHLAQTLSSTNARIEDEVLAAKTICKLRDSPMLDYIRQTTNSRVENLLSNVVINAPKIASGEFDLSKYIN